MAAAAAAPGSGGRVLVVNDDGVDSALLVPLLDALAAALPGADVRCVVPDRERSWFAKCMTRFEPVVAGEAARGAHSVRTLTGTPADCAAFGSRHAFGGGAAPDLVVSGPNLGMNAGTAFCLSSGTVGAALEGALAGVPALAVSLSLGIEARKALKATGRIPADAATSACTAALAAAALRAARGGAWPAGVDCLNVNLPQGFELGSSGAVGWERTVLARSRYADVWQPHESLPDTYVHAPREVLWEEAGPGTDRHALLAGRVSVTALALHGAADAGDIPWLGDAFGTEALAPEAGEGEAPPKAVPLAANNYE